MAERFWKQYLTRSSHSFWWLLTPVMGMISGLYFLGSRIHRAFHGSPRRVGIPVVSIGNVSVGGSGKTPTVIFLAECLSARGVRVGIVSSGYGRSGSKPASGFGSELDMMSADEIGDEVKLLAHHFPQLRFSVAVSKTHAAEQISQSGSVDLILVDDGFQHHGLFRDLDIVLWDATVPVQSIHLLPHGVLREPVSSLKRAGVVILTRVDQCGAIEAVRSFVKSAAPHAHIFEARFIHTELIGRSTRYPMTFLNQRRVMLFAGIGNFGAFRRQVEAEGAIMASALEFDDHQHYDRTTLERIANLAAGDRVDLIVTTGKDFVKLGDFDFGRECCYLGLTVDMSPSGDKLVEIILQQSNMKDAQR
jgi:tetraacyldisaccharide 4'-kinase